MGKALCVFLQEINSPEIYLAEENSDKTCAGLRRIEPTNILRIWVNILNKKGDIEAEG
jgi:hypothetical protein